ncbi:hypothetical protein AAGC94_04930 [Clostridium sporogenes]|uniref:hypothetical protein n=1 Tax=Clostridium TaxID=1485 RepID=UPI000E0E603E|nr:hypothetical protein [Clostridium sporogenes]MCW6086554.1 hypothetical protein [Clostridium sporogenes]
MKEIYSEKLKINLIDIQWIIKCISYDGEESPYRILHDKNEILILNKYDYIAFHAKYDKESINIEQKDLNMTISIKNNEMLIYNTTIDE